MTAARRRQRRQRRSVPRWRRLLVEIFEPRQLLAPVALADSYVTPEDTLLTISAPGVLANDTGGAVSAVLGSGPLRGLLSLNAAGGFAYTPAANLFGPDSFTYRASDGSATSGLATVSLTVTAVNIPPVAMNDTYFATEDMVLTVPVVNGLLANDTDPDLPPPTLSASITSPPPPSAGTVSVNLNGSFVFTPSLNFVGVTSFTYRANDGALSSHPATVTISVVECLDRPSFGYGGSDLTVNDSTGPGYSSNWVTNLDSQLSVKVTTDKPELFAVLPAIDVAGTLSFTPAWNSRGIATLTVVIQDDSGLPVGCNTTTGQFQNTITIHKPFPWHNTTILAAPLSGGLDVDSSGSISPIDAVLVINYLNSGQPTYIPSSAPIGGPIGMEPGTTAFIDTGGAGDGHGDNTVAPIDAVLVINWLNAHPPVQTPGESGFETASEGPAPDQAAFPSTASIAAALSSDLNGLIALFASEQAQVAKRRRGGR